MALPGRDIAQEWMGPLFEPVRDFFWRVFGFGHRTAPFWIATAVLVAFLLWLVAERKKGDPIVRGFLRYAFPSELYRHESTRADLRFFFVDKLLVIAGLGALSLGTEQIAQALLRISPAATATPTLVGCLIATVLTLVAFDFGAWLQHMLSHRVGVLWEFHKVHHSVEVLTPLANYREHPVDALSRAATQAVLAGFVLFVVCKFIPGAQLWKVAGVHALYLPTYVLANLRHSHVWLNFSPFWSRIFSSPAQHQCHHGIAPRHIDINYGLVFSVWDWMFGTLYVPRERETVEYGIVGDARPYPTVRAMYWLPFKKAWLRWRQKAPIPARLGGAPVPVAVPAERP